MMPNCYHHDVRTTLTLDEDTTRRLRDEMRRTGRSFKETVNEAIRVGLSVRPELAPAPFRIAAAPLGLRPGLSYDTIGELIGRLEGENAR